MLDWHVLRGGGSGEPQVRLTWQPVRILSAGGFHVALDDTDPYRDCGPSPTAPRLTEAEAAQWKRDFRAAWQEIEREHEDFQPWPPG